MVPAKQRLGAGQARPSTRLICGWKASTNSPRWTASVSAFSVSTFCLVLGGELGVEQAMLAAAALLARYMAMSAARISASMLAPCSGDSATPTDAPMSTLWARQLERLGDRQRRRGGRSARSRQPTRCRGKNMVNSSPASRASNGRVRALAANSALTTTRRRLATMISSWSPRAWPRLSLTLLNRSRSTNSIADLVPSRASPSSLSASERKCRRLGSEVTGSYMPSAWAFSIDARTSANRVSTAAASFGIARAATGGAGEMRSPSSTAIRRSPSAASARALSLLGRSDAM